MASSCSNTKPSGRAQLLKEFLSTVTDEQILEEAAGQKLKLDKETIGQLRDGACGKNARRLRFSGGPGWCSTTR